MTQLFANNAESTLASSANSSVTTLTLTTGQGARFPSPSGGDFFTLTLTQAGIETSWEIVRVTARSTDTLTVTRAQEGTSAAAWSAGDKAELRITAGVLWPLPNIDQSIVPTWTGGHRFNQAVGVGASNSSSTGSMLVVAGAQFNSLLVRSTGNSGGVGSSDIYLGSATGDLAGGIVGYDHSIERLLLGAGGAVKMHLNSSGALGSPGANFGSAGQVFTSAGSGAPASWSNLPGANPSASVGLSAVNGAALTFMRSDGAPALLQSISPTWTGNHTFSPSSGDTLFSAGRVGVGVSPARTVDVEGTLRVVQSLAPTSGAITLRQSSDNVNGGFIQWTNYAGSAEKGWLHVDPSSNMIFATVSSERLRISSTGSVEMRGDNQELRIGAGGDLKLYHDGTDSYLDNDSGALRIESPGNVGVGMSPARTVDIEGTLRVVQSLAPTSGAVTLRQSSDDANGGFIQWTNYAGSAEKGWLHVDPSSNMIFAAGSSECVRIESSGNVLIASGQLALQTAGKGISIKEGSNAKMGRATLTAGVAVVNTTAVTSASEIFLTYQSFGTITLPSSLGVSARTSGTSFTITSAALTDTSVVGWIIYEPS